MSGAGRPAGCMLLRLINSPVVCNQLRWIGRGSRRERGETIHWLFDRSRAKRENSKQKDDYRQRKDKGGKLGRVAIAKLCDADEIRSKIFMLFGHILWWLCPSFICYELHCCTQNQVHSSCWLSRLSWWRVRSHHIRLQSCASNYWYGATKFTSRRGS